MSETPTGPAALVAVLTGTKERAGAFHCLRPTTATGRANALLPCGGFLCEDLHRGSFSADGDFMKIKMTLIASGGAQIEISGEMRRARP